MIYADYNGSAPLHPSVKEYLCERIQSGPYANPNSIHSIGKKMLFGMEKCRRVCAKALGAKAGQIVFNSGSSEGISQVFHSVMSDRDDSRNIIITSGIEHSAVVQSCEYYSNKGAEVLTVKTKTSGVVDIEDFANILKTNSDKVAMVCIMAANNESGVIQPWKEISKLCQEHGVTYFSDTTQFIGKTEFNFEESGMDFAVVSGHKVGALIGSGFIIAKDPTTLRPIIFGGGQEKGLRGGTQNYMGIETLAVAFDAFERSKDKLSELAQYRVEFEKDVQEAFPKAVIIGDDADRLASTTMIALPGVHGQAVQIELESQNIFVTTSSACSDNEPETSKVLRAMGIQDDVGRGVVRISLCCGAAREDYQKIATALKAAYAKLSGISNY
ncbi:MAG: cysteine desulfurase [Bacteriovoracaceae bacterium]|nr:cysteine desulfurase [Bacteriovoracaceae bacterium]